MTPTTNDFYRRLRARIESWCADQRIKPAWRDSVLALPDLFHLLARLALDSRVSAKDKGILAVALAYVVSPLDLVPDWIAGVGFLDDLLVVVLALDYVLGRVPAAVVTEHWAGSGDVLALIRTSLDKADEWVGSGMFRRIRDFMAQHGLTAPRGGAATGAAAAPPPPPRATAGPAAKAKGRPKAPKKAVAGAPARRKPRAPKRSEKAAGKPKAPKRAAKPAKPKASARATKKAATKKATARRPTGKARR